MSQYFIWANPKKKEWIECDPFDEFGSLFGAASVLGNRYTDAVCTLLAGPWRNDPVMFVGDYFTPKAGNRLRDLFDGCPYDAILDNFREVTGLFSDARGLSHAVYDENASSEDIPYDGPFSMEVHHYRYALNKTRHEFVDRDQGPISAILDNDGKHSWLRLDPLVSLLTPRTDPDEWDGRWCCDEMVMQDEAPDPAPGLRNVTVSACGPWAHKHLLFASDEEVSRLASSAAFKRELRARGIKKEPQGSIELKGAVEMLIRLINKQEGRK